MTFINPWKKEKEAGIHRVPHVFTCMYEEKELSVLIFMCIRAWKQRLATGIYSNLDTYACITDKQSPILILKCMHVDTTGIHPVVDVYACT